MQVPLGGFAACGWPVAGEEEVDGIVDSGFRARPLVVVGEEAAVQRSAQDKPRELVGREARVWDGEPTLIVEVAQDVGKGVDVSLPALREVLVGHVRLACRLSGHEPPHLEHLMVQNAGSKDLTERDEV